MFPTRSLTSLTASSLLACSLLTGLAQAEDGLPTMPDRLLFGPTADSASGVGLQIEVVWTASLAEPTSTTLDLSTDIYVHVGDYSAVQTVRVFADPGAGFDPDGTFGGPCGTGSVDGVDVGLIDLSQGAGVHCQFPWIKTSFPVVPQGMFDENDVIEVRLVPTPGAVLEFDTSNDSVVESVGDAFYDRTFDSVELVPVPGTQDVFDIVVEYKLAYDTGIPPEDLRTDIVMEHDGKTLVFPAWDGPWQITPFAHGEDFLGETCAVIKSGGETVTTLTGQPYQNAWGAFDCACVSEPIRFTIPSVQVKDGDELALFLTHAPGALPEPSGLDQDTWIVCSSKAWSSTYGQGKAGTFGVPALDSIALPVLGQPSGILMKEALPGATPVLFLGFKPLDVPFGGGRLLVDPVQVLVLPVAIAADGTLALPWILPADPTLCGASVFFQIMFMDPGAAGPLHAAMTNGLNQVFGG
ncbi:MAG: hypothetical protein H6825_11845 [Planctomycetes bacterium]|nr:hypothetical protein [Planctomycetota bacterium]